MAIAACSLSVNLRLGICLMRLKKISCRAWLYSLVLCCDVLSTQDT